MRYFERNTLVVAFLFVFLFLGYHLSLLLTTAEINHVLGTILL